MNKAECIILAKKMELLFFKLLSLHVKETDFLFKNLKETNKNDKFSSYFSFHNHDFYFRVFSIDERAILFNLLKLLNKISKEK